MINITGDGTSPTAGIPITKGTYLLNASGTFGPASVQPQQRIDGTNWQTFLFNGAALNYTAPAQYIIQMVKCQLRYVTTGSDSTTSVFMIGTPPGSVGGGQADF